MPTIKSPTFLPSKPIDVGNAGTPPGALPPVVPDARTTPTAAPAPADARSLRGFLARGATVGTTSLDVRAGAASAASTMRSTGIPDAPASPFIDGHFARGSGTLELRPGTLATFDVGGVARVDVPQLAAADPVARLILDLAQSYGVTVGFWGGTARDLLTGRERGDSSDVDLIYDSREPAFADFRRALLEQARLRFPDHPPQIDFALDRNTNHQVVGPYRGVTIEKLGVLADGRVIDFTGMGLRDLSAGLLRYNCPEPYQAPGISSIFRMVGALIQNRGMRFADETEAEVHRVMTELYGPHSENVARLRSFGDKKLILGPLTSLYHWGMKKFMEGDFRNGVLGGLLSRGQKLKREGRKKHGENLLDFQRTLGKIVKGNIESDPARAAAILRRYGLVDLMRNIGAAETTAPLLEAAERARHEQLGALLDDLRPRAAADTLRYGLRQLAANYESAGDGALAARCTALAAEVGERADPGVPAGAAIVELLRPEIEAGAIAEGDLRQLVHVIFNRGRGGLHYDEAFRLEEPRPLPPTLGPPPDWQVQRGVEPAVDAVDPTAPHSMGDLHVYLDARLGRALVRDWIVNRRTIELHSGSLEESMASLAARGFTSITRAHAPKTSLFNQIYLAQNESGEVRTVITEIHGADRMRHWQHLVRLARHDGERVRDDQIERYGDPVRDNIDLYREFSRTLLRSGLPPSQVVIGFKNTLLRDLDRRQAAADRVGVLREALGDDAPAALLRALRGAGEGTLASELAGVAAVLASEPREVLARHERVVQAESLIRALAPLAAKLDALRPYFAGGELRVPNTPVARDVGSAMSDQAQVTYVDADGHRRSLLLVRTPYGDAAGVLGRALSDIGVEEVLQIGTAGGIGAGVDLGDVVVPDAVGGGGGDLAAAERFTNALGVLAARNTAGDDALELGRPIYSVDTPLEETAARIAELGRQGYAVVDVETAELVAGLRDSPTPARFGAAHIVTDIPGSDDTLATHIPAGVTEAALSRLTDLLLDHLRVERIERTPPAMAPASSYSAASALATTLMKRAGVPTTEHGMMHYALSRYIINGTSDAGLRLLAESNTGDDLAAHLDSRWRSKVERTLAAPFADAAVLDNMERLRKKLAGLVDFIQSHGGAESKYTIYLMGSFTKGRFGATSDLDVLIDTEDEALRDAVLDSEWGYRGRGHDDFTVGTLSYAASRMDFYRPALPIGDGVALAHGDGALEAFYFEVASAYGIDIARDGDAIRVSIDEARAATSAAREVPRAAERVLEIEKRYRRLLDTDFILDFVGRLGEAPELEHVPLARLLDIGEDLATALIPRRLDAANVQRYLDGPRGAALQGSPGSLRYAALGPAERRDLVSRLPLGDIPELLGITDPLEGLAVLYAGAERLLQQGRPTGNPFAAEMIAAAERAG